MFGKGMPPADPKKKGKMMAKKPPMKKAPMKGSGGAKAMANQVGKGGAPMGSPAAGGAPFPSIGRPAAAQQNTEDSRAKSYNFGTSK